MNTWVFVRIGPLTRPQLYTDGNSRLAELERALDELHHLISQMAAVRSSGGAVTEQCKEIQDKIDITSTKISNSMTSLNELINNKHGDSKHLAKVLVMSLIAETNCSK